MLRAGHILQLCVFALLGIAMVMVHSAGMAVGQDAVFSLRQGLYAALAIVVMLIASRLDVRGLLLQHGMVNPLGWVFLLSLILVGLTLIPGVGRNVNGASRWLSVGPISFQPSELVKWSLIAMVAWWCGRRAGVMHRFWIGLAPVLVLIGVACGMVIMEDLGTAVLIGAVVVVLLLAGGARWWQLVLSMAGPAYLVYYMIANSEFRRARITAFMDPWADPQGNGYHAIQSMLAIASGGLPGRGIGGGIQKFGYLPEDTTDFIFAIICEELGLAGAVLVVAIYLTILWTGLSVVRDCRDLFGRLLALGVILTIGFQATINLLVVTVLCPTKGIALPLISAGGTGWVMTAAAVGLVVALDEANHMEELDLQPAIA